MARKKKDEEVVNQTPDPITETGTATMDPPSDEPPPSDTNGTVEGEVKKRPVMKFGPYPVDKNTNVQVAVWDRQLTLQGGREVTVYSATLQCSYWDQKDGAWKNTDYYRGSALPIVAHALLKAYDWILEARNGAKKD